MADFNYKKAWKSLFRAKPEQILAGLSPEYNDLNETEFAATYGLTFDEGIKAVAQLKMIIERDL